MTFVQMTACLFSVQPPDMLNIAQCSHPAFLAFMQKNSSQQVVKTALQSKDKF